MFENAVQLHYFRTHLLESIDRALKGDGVDPLRPRADDLSPYDEFHVGGASATADFLGRLKLSAGMTVLDIGSGLGGPARYAAREFGANIVGLDLTPEYCDVATELSRRTGLSNPRTVFRHGDAMTMDFAERSFSAAYTIHTGMNIEDKIGFFQSVHHVLKPGSVFGIYDVLAGPAGTSPEFPLPWASMEEQNYLVTPADMEMMLDFAGFELLEKDERIKHALDSLENWKKKGRGRGLALVLGADFDSCIVNLTNAVENGACAPWIFVARRR